MTIFGHFKMTHYPTYRSPRDKTREETFSAIRSSK